jgi:hypothetical protein
LAAKARVCLTVLILVYPRPSPCIPGWFLPEWVGNNVLSSSPLPRHHPNGDFAGDARG